MSMQKTTWLIMSLSCYNLYMSLNDGIGLKLVMIGNTGAGKSWLSRHIARMLKIPVYHLDQIYWKPGSFTEKQSPEYVSKKIKDIVIQEKWIVEGSYGDLALECLKNATLLFWLNPSKEENIQNLQMRGTQEENWKDKGLAKDSFMELINWAHSYWDRTDVFSFPFHERIFNEFKGEKIRFESNDAVKKYLKANKI